jgi:hypothetical protein
MGKSLVFVEEGYDHLISLKSIPGCRKLGHRVTLNSPASYYSGIGPGMFPGILCSEEPMALREKFPALKMESDNKIERRSLWILLNC